jgi:hydrogenase maturation protease
MTTPDPTRPPLLVLGVGNALLGDDGAGLELLGRLRADLDADARFELVDGGTQGLALLGVLDGRAGLLLVDAVRRGAPPGTVHVSRDPLALASPAERGPRSAHGGNAAELLAAACCLGTLPPATWLVGIEPERLETRIGLSPAVDAALDGARRKALALLGDMARSLAGPEEVRACTS